MRPTLMLRCEVIARYAKDWMLEIRDISDFVCEQKANATAPYDRLVSPREDVYPVADMEVARRLGLSPIEAGS
jgi:hypothetical protein